MDAVAKVLGMSRNEMIIKAIGMMINFVGVVLIVTYAYLISPLGRKAIHEGAVAIHNGNVIAGKAVTKVAKAKVRDIQNKVVRVGTKNGRIK